MTTMPKPNELTESLTAACDAWCRLIELTDDDNGDAEVVEESW